MNLAVLRPGDPNYADAWQRLGGRQLERSALYGPESLNYYRVYRQAAEIDDLSFVVADGRKGLISFKSYAFRDATGMVELSCYGLPSVHAEDPDSTVVAREAARRLFKEELSSRVQHRDEPSKLLFRDHLDRGRVSYLGHVLLGMGAIASPHLSQMVDLSAPEVDLRAALSKSVRWSINWGMKTLTIDVFDRTSITSAELEAFRALHIEAAGHDTRSQQTWDCQLQLVRAGEGFVVMGRLAGTVVTAALFIVSAHHCFYGVSASKRELFDKPLAHAVIWRAMLFAKNRGIRLFEMGEQYFPFLRSERPTDKEFGISFFKRSFGGDTEICLNMTLPLAKLAPT